jgi:hypothetical protein
MMMKIEVGKKYVLNNGDVVGPLELFSVDESFLTNGSGLWLTADGRGYCCDISDPQSIHKEYISESKEPNDVVKLRMQPVNGMHGDVCFKNGEISLSPKHYTADELRDISHILNQFAEWKESQD